MILDPGSLLTGTTSLAALVWPRGVALPYQSFVPNGDFNGVLQSDIVMLGIGAIIPAGTDVKLAGNLAVNLRDGDGKGANWAIAQMLPEGSQSWTMRLVAGADVTAADNRLTNPYAVNGTLRLADTHYGMIGKSLVPQLLTQAAADDMADPSLVGQPASVVADIMGVSVDEYCSWGPYCVSDPTAPVTYSYAPGRATFSVLRTGTGDLDLVTARDLSMQSLYGVYTAGTSSITQAAAQAAGFDLARGAASDVDRLGLNTGLVLGNGGAEFEKFVNESTDSLYRTWYPDQGGNLLLSVGGNLTGDVLGSQLIGSNDPTQVGSASAGNWLWRQGSGSFTDATIASSWWINFGSYVADGKTMRTAGFTGFGTLGGGNVDVRVGGDAGMLNPRGTSYNGTATRSQALVLAVGSTGRIVNGELQQTGGGDLDVRIGGGLNPALAARSFQDGNGRNVAQRLDLNGALIDLRGTVRLDAGVLGGIQLVSGSLGLYQDPKETRAYDPFVPSMGTATGGLVVVAGDATVSLTTRGDLVLGGAGDAGRGPSYNPSRFTAGGAAYDFGGYSWFSLWTDRTAIDLFSAGGNLTPITASSDFDLNGGSLRTGMDYSPTDGRFVYPSILRAVAASGNIYYGPSALYDGVGNTRNNPAYSLVLAPGSRGELSFLAADSIYAGGYAVNPSGAAASILATPFNPGFGYYDSRDQIATNAGNTMVLPSMNVFPLFAFGGDTASGTNAGAAAPARFYARDGDIVGLRTGEVVIPQTYFGRPPRDVPAAWYEAARPVWIKAGRDIVNSGTPQGDGVYYNLLMHNAETDVSIVSAGRDLIYSSFTVAGPGTLEISAGRNIQMDDRASVTSIGAVASNDTRVGAGISMIAGAGAAGPDYQALLRYLDPANVVAVGTPLDGSGKVARTYEKELAAWLTQRHAFKGTVAEARSAFDALAPEQQRIFLRDVY